MTPTARTLQECRQRGWLAQVTEHWVDSKPFKRRRDLFGFIDVLAIDPDANTVVAIQCTSGSNAAARITKILTECGEAAEALAKCGWRLEVWAWKKYAQPVNRRRWRARIEVVEI